MSVDTFHFQNVAVLTARGAAPIQDLVTGVRAGLRPPAQRDLIVAVPSRPELPRTPR